MASSTGNNKDSRIEEKFEEKHNPMGDQTREDASRLPPRCRPPSLRYHPYRRLAAGTSKPYVSNSQQEHLAGPSGTAVNVPIGEQYNTGSSMEENPSNADIGDPTAFLKLPPPPSPSPETIAQINAEHEVDPLDLAYALEDAQLEAVERRARYLAATIFREFSQALQRARHE